MAWKSIQMREELVVAIVRPGYAIVKGKYHLLNHSADTLHIRTGYPVNASYRGAGQSSFDATEILFDDLFALKVRVNGGDKTLSRNTLKDENMADQDWYVWETTYLPNSETVVEVYFLVNTNEAIVRHGYAKDERNAFMYVLETGAHWKPPIEKGEVRVRMEGVEMDEIAGVSPDSVLHWSAATSMLRFTFTNLVPTPEDNIIVTYGEKLKDFDFGAVVKEKEKHFADVEKLASATVGNDFVQEKFGDPFEVHSISGVAIAFWVFIGVVLLLLAGVIWLIVYLVRRANRKVMHG